MYTILICAVIGAVVLAVIFYQGGFDVIDGIGMTILGTILGAVFGALLGLVVALGLTMASPSEKVTELVGTSQLAAFNDGRSIHGSFFLGCGTIENQSYYFYYKVMSDGGLKQGRVKVDYATLYEQDRKDGLLEVWETREVIAWKPWALPDIVRTYYKIYVPRGTVLRRFVADLE